MTIRQQVIQALLTIFAGINGNPPYQSTVEKVFDYDIGPFEEMAHDVMLGVFVQAYSLPRGLTRLTHAQDVKGVLSLGVRGLIRSDVDTVETLKSNLIDDIGRALYSNINLGLSTNATYHDGITITQERIDPVGSGALGMFLGSMQVTFLLDPSNP